MYYMYNLIKFIKFYYFIHYSNKFPMQKSTYIFMKIQWHGKKNKNDLMARKKNDMEKKKEEREEKNKGGIGDTLELQ